MQQRVRSCPTYRFDLGNGSAKSARRRGFRRKHWGTFPAFIGPTLAVSSGERNISLLNIERLAVALGISMSDLMP